MEDVKIIGYKADKEGVLLYLNKKTKLKTGHVTANEFWVAWDKIGKLLFDGYLE